MGISSTSSGFLLNTPKPIRVIMAPQFALVEAAESCLEEGCPVDEVAMLRTTLIRQKRTLMESSHDLNNMIAQLTALEIELAGAVSTDDDGSAKFTDEGKAVISGLVGKVVEMKEVDEIVSKIHLVKD